MGVSNWFEGTAHDHDPDDLRERKLLRYMTWTQTILRSGNEETIRATEIKTEDPQSNEFWNHAIRECLENNVDMHSFIVMGTVT